MFDLDNFQRGFRAARDASLQHNANIARKLGVDLDARLHHRARVDLVGPLPSDLQSYVVFTAGVSARSRVPDTAKQLIKFLTAPQATRVIQARGMEPS